MLGTLGKRAREAPEEGSSNAAGGAALVRGAAAAAQCAVCGIAGRKYKCPACAAPYCSAGCCAAHKAECAAAALPAALPPASTRPPPPPPPAAGSEDTGADPRRQASLSDSALARIRAAPPLRAALRDRRLRTVLALIDAAADRPRALAEARVQWGAQLQVVLDDMLLAVGAARRRHDGGGEFIG